MSELEPGRGRGLRCEVSGLASYADAARVRPCSRETWGAGLVSPARRSGQHRRPAVREATAGGRYVRARERLHIELVAWLRITWIVAGFVLPISVVVCAINRVVG